MYDINTKIFCIISTKENPMSILETIMRKILPFEKEPQKIGLTQIKEETPIIKKAEPSLKNKDIKLSDLMRRAS